MCEKFIYLYVSLPFMKRLLLVFAIFISTFAFSMEANLLKYISGESPIKEGGTDIFEYKGNTYIITVSYLVAGSKTEAQCKVVGASKVKRDMISFVNGSTISSSTILVNEETMTGSKVESKQLYVEKIHEEVLGSINELKVLGGWYSEDRETYYYAMYKIL